MPHEFDACERTAGPLVHGVSVASPVFMLSTVSPQPTTALDAMAPDKRFTADWKMMVGTSCRLPSAFPYPETATVQEIAAAFSGRTTPLPGTIADRREHLRERIRAIMVEADNCQDRVAPSPEAINDALRFVDLLPADSRMPHVSVADDGEINFFKRGQGLFVDVGFFGDGYIHYYACVENIGIDVDESQPFNGRSLPRDLVIPMTMD